MVTDKEIKRAVEVIKLRSSITNVINNIYLSLNEMCSSGVDENVGYYKNFRIKLIEIEVPKEDIEDYDNKFINLPWKENGYEISRI